MYERSGQQFFKINTGIQSVLEAFDKSKLVVTFLTNLGVAEILCSFKLVLEWKIGKEIPQSSRLEFLESFLANDFTLLDTEVYTSGPSNKGGITDLLAIRQKSREPSFWEVIDSCFISISKFGSFKNSFGMIISLSELYFRFKIFILLLQTKK